MVAAITLSDAVLVSELESQARAMNLSVEAYIRFLLRCQSRNHTRRFREAARAVFSKYPETMRKLAQ